MSNIDHTHTLTVGVALFTMDVTIPYLSVPQSEGLIVYRRLGCAQRFQQVWS